MAVEHRGYGLKQEATKALTQPGLGGALRVVKGRHGEAGAHRGGAARRTVVAVWGYLGVSRWSREWDERVAAVARQWPTTAGSCRGKKGGWWSGGQLWCDGAAATAG
jgi:hypothetical protein